MASKTDIADLSPDQQSALDQYIAVTNQEVEAAIPILARSQWNVQVSNSLTNATEVESEHVC